MALELGPFAGNRLGDVGPAPAPASSFTAIAADGLSGVGDLQAYASYAYAGVAGVDPTSIDAEHGAIMGAATDENGRAVAATANLSTAPRVAAGQIVPWRAGQVSPYLPGPETGVSMNLVDPPQLGSEFPTGDGPPGKRTGSPPVV